MTPKTKYGDRRGWTRILSSDYVQTPISEDEFDGYITLFRMNVVREPLYVPCCGQTICIADAGYSWLYQIPKQGHHAVTAMFNGNGDIVQWYIDICSVTGVGRDDVPWFEDLYLDVVVLPSGEFELIDADELQQALNEAVIDQNGYDLAWKEASRVQDLLGSGRFDQLSQSAKYRDTLLQQL